MRVLHVLSSLNIGSGIANFVMSYFRKIVKEDIQFDFLLFNTVAQGFEEEVASLGGRVFYIAKPGLDLRRYEREVKEFFKMHCGEWDVVHIHEILVQKYIARTAKKLGGVKKVAIHSHAAKFVLPTYGVSPLKNRLIMLYKHMRNLYLLRGIKRNCDVFFACSDKAGEALYGKRMLANERYHVLKNAIDCDKYEFNPSVREKYREEFCADLKKVIILVGRLCEQKQQTFFLDVMKKLCESDSSFVLLLVGDGHLKKDIEDKIGDLHLGNNVIMTGNRSDVPELLQCADIAVLPSLTEGLGIAIIEAQAAGLPCIASTGVPEEAKITPQLNFLNLSDGAEKWAENIFNIDICRYDTRAFVEESGYDISRNAERLSDIYKLLLRKGASA